MARALLLSSALLTCSCKLFFHGGGAAAIPVPTTQLAVGTGVDEAQATQRLAQAASRYLEMKDGHLRLKNRRDYEVRVQVDQAHQHARLGLAKVGKASFEQVVVEDPQLAVEYRYVTGIARHVLTAPASAPATP
jgi:hypothetical protein